MKICSLLLQDLSEGSTPVVVGFNEIILPYHHNRMYNLCIPIQWKYTISNQPIAHKKYAFERTGWLILHNPFEKKKWCEKALFSDWSGVVAASKGWRTDGPLLELSMLQHCGARGYRDEEKRLKTFLFRISCIPIWGDKEMMWKSHISRLKLI